ncbi:MAG TPA: GNAT family N-acetyltransferase [Burkholderiaceae bacterium]|nr:GNAT family N-acetyltransferase [Burkholderiaceae bacterium]
MGGTASIDGVVIRRAEPADATGIARTFQSRSAAAGTLQNPYPSVADWVERLGRDAASNYIFVALSGDDVIGHSGLHSNKNPRRQHAWGLGISIREDWQRRGVGTRLMETVIDLADNWLGALRLELTVFSDNAAALALYRKFGFEVEGVHRAYALRVGQYCDTTAMARLHPKPPQLHPAGTSS